MAVGFKIYLHTEPARTANKMKSIRKINSWLGIYNIGYYRVGVRNKYLHIELNTFKKIDLPSN